MALYWRQLRQFLEGWRSSRGARQTSKYHGAVFALSVSGPNGSQTCALPSHEGTKNKCTRRTKSLDFLPQFKLISKWNLELDLISVLRQCRNISMCKNFCQNEALIKGYFCSRHFIVQNYMPERTIPDYCTFSHIVLVPDYSYVIDQYLTMQLFFLFFTSFRYLLSTVDQSKVWTDSFKSHYLFEVQPLDSLF